MVKNVTGYDLSKGIAGSWGTLAAASEVTFKVLPRAETGHRALTGLDDRKAAQKPCAPRWDRPAEVSGCGASARRQPERFRTSPCRAANDP